MQYEQSEVNDSTVWRANWDLERQRLAEVKRQRKGAKLRRDAQTIALRADLKRVWREATKNPPARTPAG